MEVQSFGLEMICDEEVVDDVVLVETFENAVTKFASTSAQYTLLWSIQFLKHDHLVEDELLPSDDM